MTDRGREREVGSGRVLKAFLEDLGDSKGTYADILAANYRGDLGNAVRLEACYYLRPSGSCPGTPFSPSCRAETLAL